MAGTESPTPQGAQQRAEVEIQIQYPERPSADWKQSQVFVPRWIPWSSFQ